MHSKRWEKVRKQDSKAGKLLECVAFYFEHQARIMRIIAELGGLTRLHGHSNQLDYLKDRIWRLVHFKDNLKAQITKKYSLLWNEH